jgi:hypothetical protein
MAIMRNTHLMMTKAISYSTLTPVIAQSDSWLPKVVTARPLDIPSLSFYQVGRGGTNGDASRVGQAF